jgi:selenocysteine-specific elongation factor
VDEERMRVLLKRVSRMGRVIQVAHDHFFLRGAVSELAAHAEALALEAAGEGWFKAAAFRDRIAIGRKVAIQILEYFDREGVTIRKGDLRRIHPKAGSCRVSG